MSFYKLKLNKKSENQLILTIPLLSRVIFFLLASIFCAILIFDREITVIPAILVAILFLSGCYKESWIFDKNKNLVTYGFGLLFFYKKTKIPFDLIEIFKIEGFVKGSLTKKPEENKKKQLFETEFYKLSIINSEYGEMILDTVKGNHKEKLNIYGEEIAVFCKKKLQKN